jgi:hypothetical protein
MKGATVEKANWSLEKVLKITGGRIESLTLPPD